MNVSSRLPRPLAIYALACLVAAAMVAVASWVAAPPRFELSFCVLFGFVLLADVLSVRMPSGGSMSLSLPLTMSVVALFGPTEGALVAAGAAISVDDFRQGKSPVIIGYNVGQLVLATSSAAWLYYWLGGRQLLGAPLIAGDFPAIVVPVVVLAAVTTLSNAALMCLGVAVLRQASFRRVWIERVSWAVVPQFVLAALGVAFAQVTALLGLSGLALFIFPLLVARQLYQRYVELKDAYLDTVRSLIAAIETKDAYTRGHSERVAGLAVRVGGILGLGEDTLGRLEFAALLHDLGKIGIRASVLAKRGQLTSSEFDDIRKHPEIGARILERVPYLEEVVPAVVAHHERFDGAGYCAGLSGERIPMEARILAVADAYDAMTTERPYRGARSHETAIEELRHGAGRQFDPAVVGAFLALHDALPLEDAAGSVTVSGEAVSPDA